MAKYRYYAIAVLSGLLLAIAHPGWGFDLGWLTWIGLVPLIWSLTQLTHENNRLSMRNGGLIGFAAGLVYFLIIFRWFWSIYPLDTFGIQSKLVSFVTILLIYLLSSAGMAIFWGFWSLLNTKYLILNTEGSTPGKWFKKITSLLSLPATFVIFEYLRSWGFGFLWAGSGSLFGPHWTLGNLAYSLVENPLALKLASYIGIYGLTFLVILVNLLLYRILISKFTKARLVNNILLSLPLIILVVWSLALTKQSDTQNSTGKKINFAIIQTVQPTKLIPSPQESLFGFKEQLALLNRVAKEHPESQLIVFPEASDFFKNISLFLSPAQIQNYFSGLFKKPSLILAGGRIMESTELAYSRVFLLDSKNDILGFYDKRLLMPGGEFLPYPIWVITKLFSKLTTSQFGEFRNLDAGKKEISTVNFRDEFNIAPLICSELVSPGLTKQTTQNADVIVSMASYGVFHGNRVIDEQILAITRFRAAENKKPIITAVNMGHSHVVDGQGKIILLAQDVSPQILTGSLVLTKQKTWYNKLGDLPIVLASFLLVLISILLTWFRKLRGLNHQV